MKAIYILLFLITQMILVANTTASVYECTRSGSNDGTDFNGDGFDDFLIYDSESSDVAIMSGTLNSGVFEITSPSTLVNETTYKPVVGDFDADGCSDIFWYNPGSGADYLWSGTDVLGLFNLANSSIPVGGLNYIPIVGDFDGDGSDDIFWYSPGPAGEYLWSGTSTRGRFLNAASTIAVGGTNYKPLAGDYDGDGNDDIFWYNPGAGTDYLWSGTGVRGSFENSRSSIPVGGANYIPVGGDFDGDGNSDIFWYNPGYGSEYVWSGTNSRGRFDNVRSAMAVDGTGYRPKSGDFDDNGASDIYWYKPAGTDSVWSGAIASRTFQSIRAIGNEVAFPSKTCEAQDLDPDCTIALFSHGSNSIVMPSGNTGGHMSDACASVANEESGLTLHISELAGTGQVASMSFSLTPGATILLDVTDRKAYASNGNWNLDFRVTDKNGAMIDLTAGGRPDNGYYWDRKVKEFPSAFNWTNTTTNTTEFRLEVKVGAAVSVDEAEEATSTFHSPRFLDGDGALTGTPGEIITSMVCARECQRNEGSIWLESPISMNNDTYSGCIVDTPTADCSIINNTVLDLAGPSLEVSAVVVTGAGLSALATTLPGAVVSWVVGKPIQGSADTLCNIATTLDNL